MDRSLGFISISLMCVARISFYAINKCNVAMANYIKIFWKEKREKENLLKK
jgi:hypothetical protein